MENKKKYQPLLVSAGLGSVLGSGIIVGISSTITVWQKGLGLNNSEVGMISGLLTLSIAAGSLLAGKISAKGRLIKSYNLLNILYAIGVILCMIAQNFLMLVVGAVIAGFASGADLPISLSVLSHDSPDDKTNAELVSSTQVYWTIGIIAATLCAFATSTLAGTLSGRIVMAMLVIIAVVSAVLRNTNKQIRALHEEGDRLTKVEETEKVSIVKLLFGHEKGKYLGFFISILVFYCGWNLLANTFGQFQTFMLVKAHATQTFATGAGIVLNVVCLIVAAIFAKIAGGKKRNVAFVAGIIIMIAALVGLANSGSSLYLIVAWIALQNVGSTFAGESMYKVWTQESFPDNARAGVQGFINGFSRLLCALFAFITPALVLPDTIKTTMLGFAGLIFVAGLFGLNQMRLQKKYHVGKN